MKCTLRGAIGTVGAIGYRLTYARTDRVGGLNFGDDVRIILGQSKPVLFDVGANMGQTIDMFQRVFRDPEIHAFEPSRATFEALKTRQYSRRVTLNNFALGDRSYQKDFSNNDMSVLSSFLPLDDSAENRFRDTKIRAVETVDIKTVDWYMAEHNIARVDLLKVDTQGFDLQVLKGASQSLEAGLIGAVFVELNFVKMYLGQASAREIDEFLTDHGLALVDYYEKVRQGHTLGWCTALYSAQPRQ